jgi:hypothetical protein
MKCSDCKWSKVVTDPDLNMKRYCLFNQPQVQLIPTQRGMAQVSIKPEVNDDDFCHEYTRKPVKDTTPDDVFPQDQHLGAATSIIVE